MKSQQIPRIFILCVLAFAACTTSHTVMIDPAGNKIANPEEVVLEAQTDTVTIQKEVVQRDTVFVPDSVAVAAPVGAVKDTIRIETEAPVQKRVAVRPEFNPNDKYYMFDADKSTALWKKWRGKVTELSQDEIFETLDLCCVAYDYFINECQSILDAGLPAKAQADRVAALDTGKGCTMMNFTTNLSIQLNKLGANGQLDEENMDLLQEMIAKKRQYKSLRNQLP